MNLDATRLYKSFSKHLSDLNGISVDESEMDACVKKATRAFSTRLNQASRNFSNYTLHDQDHALRVVVIMGELLTDNQLDTLNVFEHALLLLSAYSHDIGMGLAPDEVETLRITEDFQSFKSERKYQTREGLADHPETFNEQTTQDFLRNNHHLISAKLILEPYREVLMIADYDLSHPLAELSRSHGEEIAFVEAMKPFPIGIKFKCDLPFLAVILRLADYLDLDPQRAPDSLFRHLTAGNPKSATEWRKHQVSSFQITADQVLYSAAIDNFSVEKCIRDTLRGFEKERVNCVNLLSRRNYLGGGNPNSLHLKLPTEITIKSIGYEFEEFKFSLNYKKVMRLLMGSELYGDRSLFLRELVQNAIDACQFAEAAYEIMGHQYRSAIKITEYYDVENVRMIEISDNGCGMNRQIIRDYFLQVGSSFYKSFEFEKLGFSFQPISQFGIGFLSAFMVADKIEIETEGDPFCLPDTNQTPKRICLSVNGPEEFFTVRFVPRTYPGTLVRVYCKSDYSVCSEHVLSGIFIRPIFPLRVKTDDVDCLLEFQGFQNSFSQRSVPSAIVEEVEGFSVLTKDFTLPGAFRQGMSGVIRICMLQAHGTSDLSLTDVGNYAQVYFSNDGSLIAESFSANRSVLRAARGKLEEINDLRVHLNSDVGRDIGAIVRQGFRVIDLLDHSTASDKARIQSSLFKAQIDSIKIHPEFLQSPFSGRFTTELDGVFRTFSAYQNKLVYFEHPSGRLTQDGISISKEVDLHEQLDVGVLFFYDIDLSGSSRVNLSVSRNDVVCDDLFESLVFSLETLIGNFLGIWLRELDVDKSKVDKFMSDRKSVPFRKALLAGFSNC